MTSPRVAWPLGLVVFAAGAAIMILELVGVRLIAPVFGVSVYVWGSILTVFMLAMALGYAAGGRLAGRLGADRFVGWVVVAGGLLLLAPAYLAPAIGWWAFPFGHRWGPLVASLVLYLPASALLAAVTPAALQMAALGIDRIGVTAGRLYALSTVGSIGGTWLATFVLIGTFPLAGILAGACVVLALLALWLAVATRGGRAPGVYLAASAIAVVILAPTPPPALTPPPGHTLLEAAETPYHSLMVVRNPSDFFAGGASTINLMFEGRMVQGGVRETPPHHVICPNVFTWHIAPSLTPPIARILFVGAGAGVGPATFRQRYPEAEIDVVDVDPEVLALGDRYFFLGAAGDPRMHLICADGRAFVRQRVREISGGSRQPYELVILDVFTIDGTIPWHLTTREYFDELRRILAPGGALVMNTVGGLVPGERSAIFAALHRTMAAAFAGDATRPAGQVYAFPLTHGQLASDDRLTMRNITLIAGEWSDRVRPEALATALRELDARHVLPVAIAPHVAYLLGEADLATLITDSTPLLTDEYCPIETMPFLREIK